MTTTTENEPVAPVPMTRLATDGLFAAVVASLANALVRIVAVTLLGVPAGFEPLGWEPVVTTTVVGVVGATGAYGALLRVTKRPKRIFLGTAVVVLIVSFVPLLVPPAFLVDAPVSVLGTLAVMHVTTAVVVAGLVLRTGNTGGQSR